MPPLALSFATPISLPATQGQRSWASPQAERPSPGTATSLTASGCGPRWTPTCWSLPRVMATTRACRPAETCTCMIRSPAGMLWCSTWPPLPRMLDSIGRRATAVAQETPGIAVCGLIASSPGATLGVDDPPPAELVTFRAPELATNCTQIMRLLDRVMKAQITPIPFPLRSKPVLNSELRSSAVVRNWPEVSVPRLLRLQRANWLVKEFFQ